MAIDEENDLVSLICIVKLLSDILRLFGSHVPMFYAVFVSVYLYTILKAIYP